MSLVTLTNPDSPAWGFENQQAHLIATGTPYILDPDERPDAGWRQDHQFAHDDMMNAPPPGAPVWGEGGGFPSAQNFEDIDFSDDRARAFWTWTHHQEHQLAQAQTTGASTTW